MLRVINTAVRLRQPTGKILFQDVQRLWKLFPNEHLYPTTTVLVRRHFHNTPHPGRRLREYEDVFKKSVEDPEGFWGDASEDIDWYSPYTRVMNNSDPPFTKW